MKCDVPITRKPQVADPELRLAPLKKVACGSGRDGGSCLSVALAGRDQQSAERGSRNLANGLIASPSLFAPMKGNSMT
jgi:hypothetical protein